MPLAALLGVGPSLLTEIGGINPALRSEDVALIGLRDLDDREKTIVHDSGVLAITMTDIDRAGMGPMLEQAIEQAGQETAGIYVSFGGLTYREAHLLMELVAETGKLRGVDIVEVNPSLDQANATARLGAELALSALGHRIL